MRAAVAALPAGLADPRAHCIASGLIAQRCSATEARLAGLGKEVRDVFTHGDASWRDWQADRAGVRCARTIGSGAAEADARAALDACCRAAGY